VIFATHFTDFGRRHVKALGLSWAVLPQAAISYMIYISEGGGSPYYAGLNLMILGAAVLLPWTVVETLFICAATLVFYLAACFFHQGTPVDTSILYNNLYFLVLTAVICVVSSHYISRSRFEDFRLRHELDASNTDLAESYKQLAEMDRLKSEFFANVSHEFRTPLTLIVSPIEDLLRDADRLPAPVKQSLEIARQNSLRLLKLINDLLEIVRLEEGRGDVRPEPLDLGAFVPGLVDSMRGLAEAKGLDLLLEGQDEALVVEADPGSLEKVILNILSNAVKFTPSGGRITTRWRREDGTAVVEIEDTGIGIAAADLPFVFDRFRQADGSSTRKYQGVGIGLALAHELVLKHGGDLKIHSRPGSGTTLRMELSVSSKAAPSAGPAEAGTTEEDRLAAVYHAADRFVLAYEDDVSEYDSPAKAEGIPSVLIVDDEPDMRRFLASLLSDRYRTLQAADGETGLTVARERKPDLVLLDLMLPGMDGLAVCRALKDDPATKDIKILLLTARGDEESKITALESGAEDFLMKPFSSVEVKTRLANLLRTAELESDLRERNQDLESALTRLKEAEAQLVESEKMNALGNLAAGLLHEINNPLNFTMTALTVAKDSVPKSDTSLHETLGDIGEGMSRIRDIVSDLRTFASPSQESLRGRFDIMAALNSALRLAAHEVKDVTVERELATAAPVVGSRTQVTHLLMNLLVNSAKAVKGVSSRRRPLVRIAAARRDGKLRVSVWDNGVGIKAADLPKIFDPFFTTRPVGEGMGLGLSICHTIVRNHGGTIIAQSEEGEWTEVAFDLPLAS